MQESVAPMQVMWKSWKLWKFRPLFKTNIYINILTRYAFLGTKTVSQKQQHTQKRRHTRTHRTRNINFSLRISKHVFSWGHWLHANLLRSYQATKGRIHCPSVKSKTYWTDCSSALLWNEGVKRLTVATQCLQCVAVEATVGMTFRLTPKYFIKNSK